LQAWTNIDIIEWVSINTSRVRPDEWEVLKDLRLSALHDSPSAFSSVYANEVGRNEQDWSQRAARASIGNDLATFFALIDGIRVGIATGYRPPETPHEVELASMWTSPDARRTGAGRALVRVVVNWATETGASTVGLWVMRGNTSAERLYDSMGFRAAHEYEPRPSDPCADELRMSLCLRDSESSRESSDPPS